MNNIQELNNNSGVNALNNLGTQNQNNYYTQFKFKPLNTNNTVEFDVAQAKSSNYLFLVSLLASFVTTPLVVSYSMLYFSVHFGFEYANNYWLYYFLNLIILLLLAWIVVFTIFQKKSKKMTLRLLEDKIVCGSSHLEYKNIRSFVKLTNFGFFKNYTFYLYVIDQLEPVMQFDVQSEWNDKCKALHYSLALEELLKTKISSFQ